MLMGFSILIHPAVVPPFMEVLNPFNDHFFWWSTTVDGCEILHQLIGGLSHYIFNIELMLFIGSNYLQYISLISIFV